MTALTCCMRCASLRSMACRAQPTAWTRGRTADATIAGAIASLACGGTMMTDPTTVTARARREQRMTDRDADFTAYLEARQGRPAAHGVPAHRRPAPGRGPRADVAGQALPVLGPGPRPRVGRRATSAGSWSTSTTRCGGAPWQRREHAPTDEVPERHAVGDRYDDGVSDAALGSSSRRCRARPGGASCCATTSSSPRPRPPRCSASRSAP